MFTFKENEKMTDQTDGCIDAFCAQCMVEENV